MTQMIFKINKLLERTNFLHKKYRHDVVAHLKLNEGEGVKSQNIEVVSHHK